MQMANKHMKRRTSSLIIKEIHVTIMQRHFSPIRKDKSYNRRTPVPARVWRWCCHTLLREHTQPWVGPVEAPVTL